MVMKKIKFDYFEAFVKQGECAHKGAKLLIDCIENFETSAEVKDYIEKAHVLEHECDVTNHEVRNQVALSFITPIERGDILDLTCALDSFTDSIEEVINSFYIYDVRFMHDNAIEMAKIILKSTEAIVETLKLFRNLKHDKEQELKKWFIKINDIEEEGDDLFMNSIRNLHTVHASHPVRVHAWCRIFESLEDCIDACEEVAGIMGNVVLKNM
ncbi:MAG: DUF47 family protein [Eggerthellaceae bacterium]|nr:DUF47 family protein [Eggerthellaceae bacterium]